MSKQFKRILAYALVTLPMIAAAQLGTVNGAVVRIGDIIRNVVPIVLTLAFIYFVWGLAKYILAAGDSEKAKEGRSIMIYGVLALFVISAVWGITKLLGDTIGIGRGQAPSASQLTPTP